jgi:hypothetical protein
VVESGGGFLSVFTSPTKTDRVVKYKREILVDEKKKVGGMELFGIPIFSKRFQVCLFV